MEVKTLLVEVIFKAIRSSGSGGQNVNKVATKIELQFNVYDSKLLSDEQKDLLKIVIGNRLTKSGILILQCDESRSQLQNKKIIIKRFEEIISQGIIKPKNRIATKTPKSVIRKRIADKKKISLKKANRKKPDLE